MADHYGTVNDGDTYFNGRLHSFDWDNATVGDKDKALAEATELIDQFDYIGQKYTVAQLGDDATPDDVKAAELAQPLQFPRCDSPVVPDEIDRACYLIAQALLSGRDPDLDLENLSAKSQRYGSVSSSYDRTTNTQQHTAHLIPSPHAYNLLFPFFRDERKFTVHRV